MLNVIVFQPY